MWRVKKKKKLHLVGSVLFKTVSGSGVGTSSVLASVIVLQHVGNVAAELIGFEKRI